MISMDGQIQRLIREERLDDVERLLTPREWDEVPFVSRLNRIAFLSDVDVREKSRVLVVNAVKYLDHIISFAKAAHREDVVVMVSIVNWEDLHAAEPDPVIPNFWICTNVERDLTTFRLRHGASEEAYQVATWLRSGDLHQSHEVFDAMEAVTDPELRRVYVAQRDSPEVERLVHR